MQFKSCYRLVQPPVTGEIRLMDRPSAQAFFKWYVDNIPIRTEHLERCLHAAGLLDAALDFSVPSLRPLSVPFCQLAEREPMSPEHLARELAKFPEQYHSFLPTRTFTARTISLIFDVSMYFGEVFRRRDSRLRWELLTKPRNHADLNYPVVVPLAHKMNLCSFNLVSVLAGHCAEGGADYDLLDLYDIWGQDLLPPDG